MCKLTLFRYIISRDVSSPSSHRRFLLLLLLLLLLLIIIIIIILDRRIKKVRKNLEIYMYGTGKS